MTQQPFDLMWLTPKILVFIIWVASVLGGILLGSSVQSWSSKGLATPDDTDRRRLLAARYGLNFLGDRLRVAQHERKLGQPMELFRNLYRARWSPRTPHPHTVVYEFYPSATELQDGTGWSSSAGTPRPFIPYEPPRYPASEVGSDSFTLYWPGPKGKSPVEDRKGKQKISTMKPEDRKRKDRSDFEPESGHRAGTEKGCKGDTRGYT